MRSLTKNEAIAVSVGIVVVLILFGSQFLSFSPEVEENINTINFNQPANTLNTMDTTNAVAKVGDIVSVKYTGKFADGTVFDATDKHGGKPIQFQLGAGRVIKGWDQGLVGMKVGEKRSLVIPPELAYGPNDYQGIPGGSTLYFDVELVGVQSAQ